MKKHRIISTIVLLSMIISILSGCNISGNNTKDNYSISFAEGAISINVGETYLVTAQITPDPDDDIRLTWESSDSSVATVDNGLVTGISKGEATITATLPGGNSASLKVIVNETQNDPTLPDEEIEFGGNIGNKCPPMDLQLVDGSGSVNIKDYAGKVVVLNFWGTWCGPCKSELPAFSKIADEYSDEVVVLAVHSVEGIKDAPSYIEQNYSDSKIVFAKDEKGTGVFDAYYTLLGGSGSYPTTFILDENGIVRYSEVGAMSYSKLTAQLEGMGVKPNATEDVPTVTPYAYDGESVTISFYNTMGSSKQAILDEYISEFNKIYPNITVLHETMWDYNSLFDQIITELWAGNQPNIAYCYPDHVGYYNSLGATVSLNSFIDSENLDYLGNLVGLSQEQKDDIIPSFYNEGMVYDDKGTVYTMPMSKSTELLYYNKTFFENRGLAVPTTWEEMEEVCRIIKEIDPECIPLGYDSEANFFITLCQQFGTGYTSPDNPTLFNNSENKALMKRVKDWYDKGYITTMTMIGGYSSDLFVNEETGMNCYMCISSSAGASYHVPSKTGDGEYLFEVGVAPIPQANPEAPQAFCQGASVCILKPNGNDAESNRELAASWLFVKFLVTNADFQAEFAMKSGYLPVIKSAIETPEFQQWLSTADGGDGIVPLVTKVALENADSFFAPPAFNGTDDIRNQVGLLLLNILSSNADDIDAMINEQFNRCVEEIYYQLYG